LHRLRDVNEPVRIFQLGDDMFPPLRVADNSPATNLPARPNRLIGRDEEVARVRRLLAECRLVTVTAVGGSGKTRLAIAVGEEELDNRPGGVWFVDLAVVVNEGDIPAAIAATVGLQLGNDNPTDQVIGFFSDKAALIILDNCEHLVEAAAEFAERFLAKRGDAVVLTTSREAFDIDGENTIVLGSLDSTDVDSAAVRLFVERATAIDPSFQLTEQNAPTITTTCERLDGMPLAIELAASRVTVMTPAELLSGLDDRFRLLSGGRRRQRQRTLEATLDWSYDLLEPEQQIIFRALGAFAGGFTLNAVAPVVELPKATTIDLVEGLVAKSMVVRIESGEESRFALLETVHAYAEDRLVQENEAASVRDRHLEHFHAIAAVHQRAMWPELRLGARLHSDKNNISTAFAWATDNDRWTVAGELLLGSLCAYTNHGHSLEAVALFDRCIERLDESDPDLALHLRVAVMAPLLVSGNWETYDTLRTELIRSSDPRARSSARALTSLVLAHTDPDAALEFGEAAQVDLEQAEAEMPGLSTLGTAAVVAWTQACVAGSRGDLTAALHFAERGVEQGTSSDFVTDVWPNLLVVLSATQVMLESPADALSTLAGLEGMNYGWGNGDEVRVFAHLALGDLDSARKCARRHAVNATTGRHAGETADNALLLAALAHAEGNDEVATGLLASTEGGHHGVRWLANDLARRIGIDDTSSASAHRPLNTTRNRKDAQAVSVEDRYAQDRQTLEAVRQELARRRWD